jgi:hypothetical protein
MRLIRAGYNVFDNEDSPVACTGAAQVGQDLDALLIVPIMEDHFEAVSVGWRRLLKHVTTDVLASILQTQPACP